jgi:carboxyl-terminal processing protease
VRIAGLLVFLAFVTAEAPSLVHARSVSAEPYAAGRPLDMQLIADVTATALAFMAPRTLEPIPVPQLTMWGLRGLTTLDPRLSAELHDDTLELSLPGRKLLSRAAPPPTDTEGWGMAVAELTRAAWEVCEPVRRAGTGGVIRTFFDELFNHLDPYSRYAPPADAETDRARRAGQAGIGVQVHATSGGIAFREVIPDGPAALAGLRVGERVLAVDGQSIQGASVDAVSAMLGGPEGTHLLLTVRSADGRARTLDIVRARVPPQTVTSVRAGDMLVLRVSGFSRDTGMRMANAIIRGLSAARPPRGLVLDLRGNRGGLLRQAVAAAETVLAGGVVSQTMGRDPAASHVYTAHGRDLTDGLPVVVVVDGRSASAAEVLAAALADQHRAVVVGSATLGKGLVQTVLPLPDGGELLITWSRVLAPFGWPIQALGVLPQVCSSLGRDALARQLDELAHGRQPMARALGRHRSARATMPPAEILEIRAACPAAEGLDADMDAARFLIATPSAYEAALLGPPPPAHAQSPAPVQ